jgi:MoaA/NifB/PqqE/SkfB family radical SAM enzyme
MKGAGVATVRLSLETVDPVHQEITGGKVTTGAFARAVSHLRAAGYGPGELGAYILAGLPDQSLAEVEETVRFVHGLGVQAKLALFSPIPGTVEGDRALEPGADPLLHNNTVYPYLLGIEYVRDLQRVKQMAKEGNLALLRDASA